jgi:hypothetical protein
MDSTFFRATAATWMRRLQHMCLEFYHDKGGLMTSKQELDATKANICGKATRELVKRKYWGKYIPSKIMAQ